MTSKYGPKKSLGQHWLQDEASLQAMCDAAEVQGGDVVLEIGPGQGTLTEVLLERGAKVVAVEFDDELIEPLKARFSGPNFVLHHEDVLRFDFGQLPKNYKVVANIPYYLTSHLLRLLCETQNHFGLAALLVQKEVAERVAAAPGKMSTLSLSVQFYCAIGLGPVIGAKLFSPPPKVDSQILLLDYTGPAYDDLDPAAFFRLTKAGFSERRKKLRSSLSGGLHLPKPAVEEMLQRAQINPDARAQELSLADWHKLYSALNA